MKLMFWENNRPLFVNHSVNSRNWFDARQPGTRRHNHRRQLWEEEHRRRIGPEKSVVAMYQNGSLNYLLKSVVQ